ncbi:hypothetical protein ScalyP_jg3121 [Parmales sp. scaly parma]|nr:hypothetical protein ScalyP_jg3121 [Parmales sp. scaly parma]
MDSSSPKHQGVCFKDVFGEVFPAAAFYGSHRSVELIAISKITTAQPRVFSSILNNLTVTIVMISLLRKIIPIEEDRRLFGAMVVVAANAGGVWTPIGVVTTTMLWINGNLSTAPHRHAALSPQYKHSTDHRTPPHYYPSPGQPSSKRGPSRAS